MRFASPGASDVMKYDGFVIYADLPSPHDVLSQRKRLTKDGYSSSVINATIRDTIRSKHSYWLANKLKNMTGKPIFILSCNVVSITPVRMNADTYMKNVSLISQAVGDFSYIPFPLDLFDGVFLPRGEYYKHSVKLTGEKAEEEDSGHDYHHMNENGGALVLDAIVGALDNTLMDKLKCMPI